MISTEPDILDPSDFRRRQTRDGPGVFSPATKDNSHANSEVLRLEQDSASDGWSNSKDLIRDCDCRYTPLTGHTFPPNHRPDRMQEITTFIGLWPDGKLRSNDIADAQETSREVIAVIDILITLNNTDLYTAFYQYFAHVGILEIQIYQGRWGIFKTPTWEIDIDCRKYPLVDFNTEQPFYAQDFLEWLILQIQ